MNNRCALALISELPIKLPTKNRKHIDRFLIEIETQISKLITYSLAIVIIKR